MVFEFATEAEEGGVSARLRFAIRHDPGGGGERGKEEGPIHDPGRA